MIIAHTFFYTKEQLLFVTLQQEFDCKEPSPQHHHHHLLKDSLFSEILSQVFNHIKCVYQQRNQKNCVLSEGALSLTILIKIHAITFETDLLTGNCNRARGSQMPVYVSESCRTCGNA